MGGADPARTMVIVGPTAAGKTALAVALAAHLPLTVISADARQVYRGLDIGTAKPEPDVLRRVPHLGLDLIAVGERYSAGRFAADAAGWIGDVRRTGLTPVVVGGTGFYIRALGDGLFQEPDLDPERREALRDWTDGLETGALVRWAGRLDPRFAGGGRQRAARAIEVALLTGHPLSHWQEVARETGAIRPWYIQLTLPRDVLHRRIAERVDRMLERGLVNEVRGVLATGVAPDAPGLDAVGYREVVAAERGELSWEAVRETIVIATRQYAKRQETWFNNQVSGVRGQGSVAPVWKLDATLPPTELARLVFDRWSSLTPDP
ncbi:MAG TPA: tRNA (adenosine(37)-N6)-dimethylallyltransferase MiaA [Gemmatimonadales bacterium]|nr:tRNA (adenosine(37)-N6)-dimethylallyltransferase MiaA [Gemmatimonadales bacterium]